MEDIRFTPSYHYLRFSHNDQNLRFIFYKTITLGLKGVGAWRSKAEGGAEDIRFTHSYLNLRFSHNEQNLRFIFYKTLTLG